MVRAKRVVSQVQRETGRVLLTIGGHDLLQRSARLAVVTLNDQPEGSRKRKLDREQHSMGLGIEADWTETEKRLGTHVLVKATMSMMRAAATSLVGSLSSDT